jgi:hypothetical protein
MMGKPMGQWFDKEGGFMCQPNPICLHEGCNEPRGSCLGGVLCCNQPSSWSQHPSSIETGPERPGSGATKDAYPSSCSYAEQ